jgi:hypothetical protein
MLLRTHTPSWQPYTFHPANQRPTKWLYSLGSLSIAIERWVVEKVMLRCCVAVHGELHGSKGPWLQRAPKGSKGLQRAPKGSKGLQRAPKGSKGLRAHWRVRQGREGALNYSREEEDRMQSAKGSTLAQRWLNAKSPQAAGSFSKLHLGPCIHLCTHPFLHSSRPQLAPPAVHRPSYSLPPPILAILAAEVGPCSLCPCTPVLRALTSSL